MLLSAWGNTGEPRKLKALHEKTPGVRTPCSFRTAYTDAGGLRLKQTVSTDQCRVEMIT